MWNPKSLSSFGKKRPAVARESLSYLCSLIGSADSLRGQLLRGGLGSAAVTLASTLTAFIVSVALARSLGPESYGIYAFVFALVMVLAMPAQVGMPDLVVRETAKAQANERWDTMLGLWRWGAMIVASFAILIILIALVVIWLWVPSGNQKASTLMLGLAMVFLLSLGKLRGAALQGLGRVVIGQIPESLLRPGLLLVLISSYVLIFPDNDLTAESAMGLHAAAAGFAFLFGALMLRRARLSMIAEPTKYSYASRYWMSALLPLSLSAGLQVFNVYADVLILGFLRSDSEVGVYWAAVRVVALVSFAVYAINMVVMPHIARLYAQGDTQRLQRLVTISARAMFLFGLPFTLAFVIKGDLILELVLGQAYVEGHRALAILAIGHLINAFIGSVGRLLAMTGHEKTVLRNMIILVPVHLILNFIFIPIWGIDGAATATALSNLLWCFIARKAALYRLGIDAVAFPINWGKSSR